MERLTEHVLFAFCKRCVPVPYPFCSHSVSVLYPFRSRSVSVPLVSVLETQKNDVSESPLIRGISDSDMQVHEMGELSLCVRKRIVNLHLPSLYIFVVKL